MEIARRGLAVEPLAVAKAIFLLDPGDLLGVDAEKSERVPASPTLQAIHALFNAYWTNAAKRGR